MLQGLHDDRPWLMIGDLQWGVLLLNTALQGWYAVEVHLDGAHLQRDLVQSVVAAVNTLNR